MEAVAVANHSRLRRCGSRDAVTGTGRRHRPGRGGGPRAENADAEIRVEPETCALRTDSGIPCHQLRERDTVGGTDGGTEVALLDEMELVAVAYHACLDRRRRRDAVSGGGSGCGGGGGGAGGCGLLTAIVLDAVRVAHNEVTGFR